MTVTTVDRFATVRTIDSLDHDVADELFDAAVRADSIVYAILIDDADRVRRTYGRQG
jgi:hypothetical protein